MLFPFFQLLNWNLITVAKCYQPFENHFFVGFTLPRSFPMSFQKLSSLQNTSVQYFFDHSKNWIFFKLEILARDFDIGYDRTIFFHQIQSFETEKNSDKVET